jgi:phospholipid/cholesterol/gamma-HCH transport system substrate-binding protein
LRAFADAAETVVDNIETVSADVVDASRAASSFASALESIVEQNRAQVSSFLRVGLPEFMRLTEEARLLVSNLDRFVDRAQRDPARFFLGTQGSEFSR